MAEHSGSVQWRFPCAFQIVFILIVCCFMPFLPESPRYLAAVGKTEKATYALAALRGDHADSDYIATEMKEILLVIDMEREQVGSWSDCFKDHGVSGWQRVLIGFRYVSFSACQDS